MHAGRKLVSGAAGRCPLHPEGALQASLRSRTAQALRDSATLHPERFGAGPQGVQPVTEGDPRKLPPMSLSSEPVAQHRPETPASKMTAIFCLWTECPTKDLILKAMEHVYPHGSSGQPGGETV
ncbi:uncharacterized protein LOC111539856 [Piliocolobus tephrosceles]|uniref:uncharacterized protein LOC111539856 n=1 Tax=Piliocolobus tephrosceles TaxID=591936 RepID=UPI000C29669F|nr:uncharacterized protein LOC111539856 [Piliocolobus tephrosceles]